MNECQLCKSKVPVTDIGNFSGHVVVWHPSSSAWIPCSEDDRVGGSAYWEQAIKAREAMEGNSA